MFLLNLIGELNEFFRGIWAGYRICLN